MYCENATELKILRAELQDTIQLLKPSTQEDYSDSNETASLFRKLHDLVTKVEDTTKVLPRQIIVLRRLYFESMFSREDSVRTAEHGTFNWIVDEEDVDRNNTYTNDVVIHDLDAKYGPRNTHKMKTTSKVLMSFLENDHGFFFVCGKAGSGKSTLMKFLRDQRRVQQLLENWSRDKRLVFGSFYFWNSGDRLQMSLEGLYRTVLSETIGKCPELLPILFPDDVKLKSFEDMVGGSYRLRELESAMKNLFRAQNFPAHRFCFFIDGLDEYEGDSQAHFELAQSLRKWATSPDVKIVCSARPHIEFCNTFNNAERTINLPELTSHDIYRFIVTQLKRELAENGIESSDYLPLV